MQQSKSRKKTNLNFEITILTKLKELHARELLRRR
jgi:hypothetical protein